METLNSLLFGKTEDITFKGDTKLEVPQPQAQAQSVLVPTSASAPVPTESLDSDSILKVPKATVFWQTYLAERKELDAQAKAEAQRKANEAEIKFAEAKIEEGRSLLKAIELKADDRKLREEHKRLVEEAFAKRAKGEDVVDLYILGSQTCLHEDVESLLMDNGYDYDYETDPSVRGKTLVHIFSNTGDEDDEENEDCENELLCGPCRLEKLVRSNVDEKGILSNVFDMMAPMIDALMDDLEKGRPVNSFTNTDSKHENGQGNMKISVRIGTQSKMETKTGAKTESKNETKPELENDSEDDDDDDDMPELISDSEMTPKNPHQCAFCKEIHGK